MFNKNSYFTTDELFKFKECNSYQNTSSPCKKMLIRIFNNVEFAPEKFHVRPCDLCGQLNLYILDNPVKKFETSTIKRNAFFFASPGPHLLYSQDCLIPVVFYHGIFVITNKYVSEIYVDKMQAYTYFKVDPITNRPILVPMPPGFNVGFGC